VSHPQSLAWQRLSAEHLENWVDLLHAAYASNLAMGMNFTAATMKTRRGEQFLADRLVWGGFTQAQLVATFTLRHNEEGWHLNLLAVRPDQSRKGYGNLALSEAEQRALDLGASELLLDTADRHPWLLDFYRSRGYVAYGQVQKPGKTYRSVLFRKLL
jgi:GNAT superfamily N-acetyltransferase